MPTPPLNLIPFADGIQDFLENLNIDEEIIRKTVAHLLGSADALDEMDFGEIRESAFGGSWTAESMGHHTALAHDYFVRSLSSMVTTLTGTSDWVRNYHRDMVIEDEEIELTSQHLLEEYDLEPTPPGGTPGRDNGEEPS
ncbi:hypothetical protein ABFT23_19815 [Nocardioides sp. C4-1]|uniref:hypothetical protein n=1 Tax=Nocardioides sp. C4-1 TaxID=3151851 RepID=UPI003263BCEA